MVFSSTPTNCAAECAQRVRSNASKISTISLSDLVTDPLGSGQLLDQQSAANPDRGDLAVHRHQSGVSGRPRDHGHGILMSTSPEQTVHPPGACRVRWQQPKLGRGNSATDAAWRLPRKEVRRWTNMTPTLACRRRNTKAP